jgi:hypothetical protein
MLAALYRDAFILHQTILISVAENAQTSPVRTGSNNALIAVAELLAENDQSSPVRTGSNNVLITAAEIL